MTTGILHDHQNIEKQIEKQIGCMAGFLHLFDVRPQILAGKRLYTPKRFPPPPPIDSASQATEKSIGSPAFSGELTPPEKGTPAGAPGRSSSPSPLPLPLPVFESKEGMRSMWKLREAPRLSLDSRAVVDGKGSLYPREIKTFSFNGARPIEEEDESEKQRRSPSVVARLMGLEAFPNTTREPMKKAPELRRSASESRVLRDLYVHESMISSVIDNSATRDVRKQNTTRHQQHRQQQQQQQKQRKSYFNASDVFPEPRSSTNGANGSLYGEIEKRLKMRGIDEPAKDLETLKQILEALQLKGLLHSKVLTTKEQKLKHNMRNYVFEDESPIVIMKPASRPPPPPVWINRIETETSRSKYAMPTPPARARIAQKERSPQRRRVGSVSDQPTRSHKMGISRKVGSDKTRPRRAASTAEIRASKEGESYATTTSRSTATSSQMEAEGWLRDEYYKEGRSLLERCDMLINSINEITTVDVNLEQPSPVSVLDSNNFYKDESSPSPVMNRLCVNLFKDFKSADLQEESFGVATAISPIRLNFAKESDNFDSDFVYIAEILQARNNNAASEELNMFSLIEKQNYKHNSSKPSRLHRKLVFDTVAEILESNDTRLKPFSGVNTSIGNPSLREIWSEFRRIREKDSIAQEESLEAICGALLRKDMARDSAAGWGDWAAEMPALEVAVSIFEDMVAETVRDLAETAGKWNASFWALPRRKLVF